MPATTDGGRARAQADLRDALRAEPELAELAVAHVQRNLHRLHAGRSHGRLRSRATIPSFAAQMRDGYGSWNPDQATKLSVLVALQSLIDLLEVPAGIRRRSAGKAARLRPSRFRRLRERAPGVRHLRLLEGERATGSCCSERHGAEFPGRRDSFASRFRCAFENGPRRPRRARGGAFVPIDPSPILREGLLEVELAVLPARAPASPTA